MWPRRSRWITSWWGPLADRHRVSSDRATGAKPGRIGGMGTLLRRRPRQPVDPSGHDCRAGGGRITDRTQLGRSGEIQSPLYGECRGLRLIRAWPRLAGELHGSRDEDGDRCFERAIAIDGDYALARAGLSIAAAWFSIRYTYETDAHTWGARADREAKAALAADPSLAEATLALASAAGTLYGGFNWPVVIEQATQALSTDPTWTLRTWFHARVLSSWVV